MRKGFIVNSLNSLIKIKFIMEHLRAFKAVKALIYILNKQAAPLVPILFIRNHYYLITEALDELSKFCKS